MEAKINNTGQRKDVARAAHILQCFYRWRAVQILEEEGLSKECIQRGAVIAEFEKYERSFHRQTYGSREYGSRIIDESRELRLRVRKDLLEGNLKHGGTELEREVWTEMLAEVGGGL